MGASTGSMAAHGGGTEGHQEVDNNPLQRPWAGHFCGGLCRPGGSGHATNDPSVARAPGMGEVAQRRSHVQDWHRVGDSGSCWPGTPTLSARGAGSVGPDRGGRGPVGVAAGRAGTASWEEGEPLRRACVWRACLLKLSSALAFQQPLSRCKSLFF